MKISIIQIISLLTILAGQTLADNQKIIRISTGSITGIYHPLGNAICNLVNSNIANVKCVAETSSGALENIYKLNKKEVDLAFVQSDALYNAYQGKGRFEKNPQKDLRSVLSFHDESLIILLPEKAGASRMEDLLNKSINPGSEGSGSRIIFEDLVKFYGWSNADFKKITNFSTYDQAEAICDNKVNAILYVSGNPNVTVREATDRCSLEILPITGEKIDSLLKTHPYYVVSTIQADLYAGNPRDVQTIAVKAILTTHNGTDVEIISKISALIENNLDTLKKINPCLMGLSSSEMNKNGIIIPKYSQK